MNLIDLLKHTLCPPGFGVQTFTSSPDQLKEISQKIYGTDLRDEVQKKWESSLESLDFNRPITLGINSDCGGGILRGANWGPLFLRRTFQDIGLDHQDLGDVRVIPHFLSDELLNQETIAKARKALYQSDSLDLPVSPLSITETVVRKIYQQYPQAKFFGLGGDHSISYPLVRSYLEHKKAQGVKAGLLHFDAHTDLLPNRLGVDICFGSWTYHILDKLFSPEALVQVGIRASGREKEYWEKNYGIKQIWSSDFEQSKLSSICQDIKNHFMKLEIEELYITFDIDGISAEYVSATGTPEHGGLSPHQASVIISELSQFFKVTGGDLVEVAPFLHQHIKGVKAPEPESTLLVAGQISSLILQSMS